MSQSYYAFDRRRVNGPEWSVPPTFEAEETSGPSSKGGIIRRERVNRGPKDIRPIFLKTGLISQANGSSYIETGKVKIACAVYGPRQSKSPFSEKGKLNVEVKYAPFSSARRRNPMRDVEDRPTSVQVHQALRPSIQLELFPKSTIDVFITVLEVDGAESCVASASIAASAAIADAGFEMFGLVAACSACAFPLSSSPNDMDVDEGESKVPENVGIWLDPTAQESSHAKGSLVMACMPAFGTVTNVHQTGIMTTATTGKCLDLCLQRCADIHGVMSQALLEGARAKAASSELTTASIKS